MAQTPQAVPPTQQDFEKILKTKDAEIDGLKEKLTTMEQELVQAQKLKTQRVKENEEVQALKIQSEGILTKAKAMIFENTKVIKNQELQLEALGQQNESLKDVVSITKDLLEIRNLEVKQLEAKIQCMEDRVKAEKTRQDLLHKKLETMIRHNGELKREYEAQLCLFNALRERYSEKELAQGVVSDLRRDVAGARNEQQNGAAADAQNQNEVVAEAQNQNEVAVVPPNQNEVVAAAQNQNEAVAEAQNQNEAAVVPPNQNVVVAAAQNQNEAAVVPPNQNVVVSEAQNQNETAAEKGTSAEAQNQNAVADAAKNQNDVAKNLASDIAKTDGTVESQVKEVKGEAKEPNQG